jgi:hypothetical protein
VSAVQLLARALAALIPLWCCCCCVLVTQSSGGLLRYTPTVSAVLKNAWIQYLAFFAVISFLLFRLNSFVFRHKVNLSPFPV